MTNAIEKKSTTQTLSDLLAARQKSIASLVPQHLTPERLMRVAVNCVAKTPQLQQCSPESLLSAVMFAAEVGLEPGGALGHMYLVPFGTVCTPIIGYRGLAELARRSGEVKAVYAAVVREGDKFKVSLGLNPNIEHEPSFTGKELGAPTFFYTVAVLKDGAPQFEVMSVAQVDAIRARSRSGKSGPWATDYEEMAKKTVFRRLAKWLPISSERFTTALEHDSEDVIDSTATETGAAVDLKTRVRQKVEAPPEMPETPAPEATP